MLEYLVAKLGNQKWEGKEVRNNWAVSMVLEDHIIEGVKKEGTELIFCFSIMKM